MVEEKATNSYNHVLKYTGVFGGVQGLNIVTALVRNKLVAVLLGPVGMGLSSLLNTSVNFLSQVTNLGLSFSAVKHISELYDSGDEKAFYHFIKVIRVWALLTALLGLLVGVVASPLLDSLTFSWGDHTLHFLLVSPAVALMAITGGEMAILKGTRQLRTLAVLQIYTVLASLILSVPFYYFFGHKAIVPVIVLIALVTTLLTIHYSYRLYPLQLSDIKGVLNEGREMIKLGVAFIAAAIIGSGAEMIVRSYLSYTAGLDFVGLYNAGYMVTITYAGLVFSSMETDYFPRLSAIPQHEVSLRNITINRQIEVSLLLLSPMLTALIVALPLIIPLMFSKMFYTVIPMAQMAIFSMYIKSLSLPLGYTNLAVGNSKGFLLLEVLYYTAFVLFTIVGYEHWGLVGTGGALVLAYVIELLSVYTYVHCKYGISLSRPVMAYFTFHFAVAVLTYATTFIDNTLLHWGLSLCGLLSACLFSLSVLHKKTSLWNALKRKVMKSESKV